MRCSKYCTSVAADSDASPRLSDDRRLLDDVVSGHIDSSLLQDRVARHDALQQAHLVSGEAKVGSVQ